MPTLADILDVRTAEAAPELVETISGGRLRSQASVASPQRGAKAQASGRSVSGGGAPSMARKGRRACSPDGTEARRPAV